MSSIVYNYVDKTQEIFRKYFFVDVCYLECSELENHMTREVIT